MWGAMELKNIMARNISQVSSRLFSRHTTKWTFLNIFLIIKFINFIKLHYALYILKLFREAPSMITA